MANGLDKTGDQILDLKRLSERSSMSVRTLRNDLKDTEYPLPYFHKRGKIFVRWSEFLTWMEHFRAKPEDLGKKIDDMVNGLVGDA